MILFRIRGQNQQSVTNLNLNLVKTIHAIYVVCTCTGFTMMENHVNQSLCDEF